MSIRVFGFLGPKIGESSNPATRRGLFGPEGPLGTHLNAAVTSYTATIVDGEGFACRADRLGRAILPAFTALCAGIGFHHRPLDQMLPNDVLEKVGSEGQGCQYRELKSGN